MCVGCPVTQWDVTIQPLKIRPKLLWQNKSYGGHTIMTYFSLLTRMQKKASRQKVFRMISSAPDLKHILQKLNILGQRQIIQPVPVVSDCLGHFVPIYPTSPIFVIFQNTYFGKYTNIQINKYKYTQIIKPVSCCLH